MVEVAVEVAVGVVPEIPLSPWQRQGRGPGRGAGHLDRRPVPSESAGSAATSPAAAASPRSPKRPGKIGLPASQRSAARNAPNDPLTRVHCEMTRARRISRKRRSWRAGARHRRVRIEPEGSRHPLRARARTRMRASGGLENACDASLMDTARDFTRRLQGTSSAASASPSPSSSSPSRTSTGPGSGSSWSTPRSSTSSTGSWASRRAPPGTGRRPPSSSSASPRSSSRSGTAGSASRPWSSSRRSSRPRTGARCCRGSSTSRRPRRRRSPWRSARRRRPRAATS